MMRLARFPRITVACLLAGAAIMAGAALVACGTENKAKEPEQTVAPTVQATSTAQAERPWEFRHQLGITAAFAPADPALYRSLLPKQFDVPQSSLVVMAVVYYDDVTLPLTPYHEGYVLLQCSFQGQTGWYVLTMPVDEQMANAGGRALGFPKYIADQIALDEGLGSWSGAVSYQGLIVMGVGFTSDGKEPLAASSADPGLPIFLLVPPTEGPQVNEVDIDVTGERQTVTTSGTATVYADPSEPWAGLVPPMGTQIWGQYQQMSGPGWVLTAKQR